MAARRFIPVSLLALAFCLALGATAMALTPSHTSCGFCHNLHGTPGAFGGYLFPEETAEATCLTCHGTEGPNTKVAIHNNSTSTYADFSMTCTDCHGAHSYRYNWQGGLNANLIGRDYWDWPFSAPSYVGLNTIINTPNSGLMNVVFESRGTDVGDTLYNSFADADDDGDGTYDGICEVCHTQTDYHLNDGTGTAHNAGRTCTTCHKHLQNFKGEGDCVGCHDKLVGSAPDIFRQVTGAGGDFSQSSRHVFNSTGSDPTSWDCIVCHAEGDTTSSGETISTTTEHNDAGKTIAMRNVDNVSNPGTLGTHFWRWPKPSDTPTDADHTNMDNFCMSCHDSDASRSGEGANLGGASGIAVNSTSQGMTTSPTLAERMSPFSIVDNMDQDGYDAGSVTPDALTANDWKDQTSCESSGDGFTWTGSKCIIPRTSVIDVYGQFDPGSGGSGAGYNGNPSQHAVRAARYSIKHGSDALCDITQTSNKCKAAGTCVSDCSGTWDSTYSICIGPQGDKATCENYSAKAVWTSTGWGATAWVSTTLKDGTVQDVVRETATLHCADCHTVDTNAHGGANIYMLTAATIDGVCWTCHSSSTYGNLTAATSRFDHKRDANVWDAGTGSKLDSNTSGAFCLNCHGGAEYDGYGAIHGIAAGSDQRLSDNGKTQERYRFIGGSYMSMETDFTTASTVTCYMNSNSKNETRWSNCTQHGAGAAGTDTTQYSRGTEYE
jgi:hypothetical protein